MTAKKLYIALTVIAVAAISVSILCAQASANEQDVAQTESFNNHCGWLCQERERQAQRLEGAWALTVNAALPHGAPIPPARTSYTSFARGGVAILYERQANFVNPAFGAWEYQGGNKYAFTVITDAFDSAGNLLGTVKIRNRITLRGRDEFDSVGHLEVRNLAGNVLFSGCATAHGKRIKVEPLPEQCQTITPR